jgi:uncharacterized iron-regulated protein
VIRSTSRAAALVLLAVACAAPATAPAPAPEAHDEALLRRASRVFDGRTAREIGWDEAVRRLARADAVFLGETHLDRLTHEAELALLRALTTARGGQVALALEMFERDVQPTLDAYLRGEIGEGEFLRTARPWPNYRTDYRPQVEFARARGMPVIASNLPAQLRRTLAVGGQAALDALTPEQRALVPAQLFENPPEYWLRVEQATLGHGALGMGSSGSRLFDGQNLWDNAMAESVARSLDEDPRRLVVHVNGGFHTAYWQGTVWQLLQRRPDARVMTVAIETTTDLAGARPEGHAPIADVLVLVEARANSADSGVRAVQVAREHRWRLRAPPHAEAPPPLLVWFCDEGQTAEDALRLWEAELGGTAAVLALDPSFPYLGEDGILAGRWFFPGSAPSGGGLAAAALERALAEALLPGLGLDAGRVVVAGEGAGATMAILAARSLRERAFTTLAFAPRAQDEFAFVALPDALPDDRPERALRLWSAPAELAGWEPYAAQDPLLRLRTALAEWPAALAASEQTQIGAIRAALGLPAADPHAAAEAVLAAAPTTVRARFAARVLARRARAANVAAAPDFAIRAAEFADGTRLPLSSGGFGGTTIVVLPEGTSEEELAAWLQLENPDVLQQRSRFHRLRIAHGVGDRAPLAVIERLRAENAQRRDFLLVPAVFCAEPAELRALRDGLGAAAHELRLEFLPGLGDRIPLAP